MSDLVLSSYERMRRYIADVNDTDGAITTGTPLKFKLDQWIRVVSAQVAKYLNRDLHIESRTEYFDTRDGQVTYLLKAYPIVSITSVAEDVSAEWSSPTTYATTDYSISKDSDGIVLDAPIQTAKKSLRVVYTGGIAYNGTRTTMTGAYDPGLFTAGYFAVGGTSDACGIVRASSGTTLTVEVLRGEFEAGETVTEYSDENETTASGDTYAVTTIDQQSAVESYPAIVGAAEMQIRYMNKHKDDFELVGTSRDGTNLRRFESTPGMSMTKEAVNLLMPYRRIWE